ncbi:ribonuclease H-like domain-containing protein, partial [Tanacetum coccineum]
MSQPANMITPHHLSDDEAFIPLKKEYDIWAMEIEHYLEYIDKDVWNGKFKWKFKKKISIVKDGVVKYFTLSYLLQKFYAVEKERKARTILLMAITKEHLRRFNGMDDAKEIWEAIRTRFGAWSNLAMTMRTKPDVDTSTSKSPASAQIVAFISHSKSSTNKVKSGNIGAYSTCTPTSSNNFQEREVPVGFADEIDDIDVKEMDINWKIAMIAIRMKKFYKKTRRRVRIDGNQRVGFDKKKLECFKCHNTGHFARECSFKG